MRIGGIMSETGVVSQVRPVICGLTELTLINVSSEVSILCIRTCNHIIRATKLDEITKNWFSFFNRKWDRDPQT